MTESLNHKKYKISFCTTCMNRLHHLKETLPRNIADNAAYTNVEFVLLNYNSQDGMDRWVETEMGKWIKDNLLVYLKTSEPLFWNPSHAKNIATKYATGDILCNVDADHFTGKDYANYVNECFNKESDIFLSGRAPGAKLDMMGRFCLWKDDFLKVNGYDEGFLGYGFEDQDIFDRLKLIGRREKSIDFRYLKTISHQHNDRVKGISFMKDVKFILISEFSPETRALIIKNDHSFEQFVLVTSGQTVSFDENRIETGAWEEHGDKIMLHQQNTSAPLQTSNEVEYTYNNTRYRRISDNIDALYYYSLLFNQRIYKKNIKDHRAIVNPEGFGKATVYKNFQPEPIVF